MEAHYTLPQILIPLIAAMLGSNVLTGIITTRSAMRLSQAQSVHSIETEVRAQLRTELGQERAARAAQQHDLDEQKRRLDRITDNMVPYVRKVAQMCLVIRQFVPARHRPLFDDVARESNRLAHFLGTDLSEPPEMSLPAASRSP